MAQRLNKRFRRIPTDEVQGEGSYVVFKALTFEELFPFLSGIDANDQQGLMRISLQALASMIHEWDWVDDDGNPLPSGPEGFGLLTLDEQNFLLSKSGLREVFSQKN